MNGILESQELFQSTGPVHARYGDGQYFTDIEPERIAGMKKSDLTSKDWEAGKISRYQLVGRLFGRPTSWGRSRTTHFIEIDVTGLGIVVGRPNVQLHPNSGPLDLTGRIVRTGKTPF
jgi:hypothetical protein